MKKNKKNKKKERELFSLPFEVKKPIFGISLILLSLIVVLSFFGRAGIFGEYFLRTAIFLIGKTTFLLPLFFLICGIMILRSQERKIILVAILSFTFLILGISGTLGVFQRTRKLGGSLGWYFSSPLLRFFGFWASLILLIGLAFLGFFILSQFSKKEKSEEAEEEEKKPSLVSTLVRKIFVKPEFKVKPIEPIRDFAKEMKTQAVAETFPKLSEKKLPAIRFERPPIELLDRDKGEALAGDIRSNVSVIKRTLENFGIPVEMAEVNIGPTVTQYTLKPAEGIKLSKITGLSNDLALALASHPIRIEAPIPGKSLVGIEVPNKLRQKVRLGNLIEKPEFLQSLSNLTLALGRDVAGNPIYADLGKMPHLLIAGATGTGKTICLNSLILSLIYRNSPEILRFILVDPKRVEFPVYEGLPHLLAPIIYDSHRTVFALKWLIGEMERRFAVLSEAKTRDIGLYNEQVLKKGDGLMPYIILAVDELADLMASRPKEMEAGIVRLAQMARAVGIHLVLATQRPSVEVITGLIKANITSRISFQVATQVDSRTILDASGAEKLLGSGDLLYLSAERAHPRRIQGVYISDKEVKRVMDYLREKMKDQKIEMEDILKEEFPIELGRALESSDNRLFDESYGEDPLYPEAEQIVIRAKKASASLLQRHLRIGYARAARLLDILEERGVVGPAEGAKPREVYIKQNDNENLFSQETPEESVEEINNGNE